MPQGKGRILSWVGRRFSQGLHTWSLHQRFRCTDAMSFWTEASSLPIRCAQAIVMVDVFHQIPDAVAFLEEPPGVSRLTGRAHGWSRGLRRFQIVYSELHQEPIDTGANELSFPGLGPFVWPLCPPWIEFERDHELFRRRYTDLKLMDITGKSPSCTFCPGVFHKAVRPGLPLRCIQRH